MTRIVRTDEKKLLNLFSSGAELNSTTGKEVTWKTKLGFVYKPFLRNSATHPSQEDVWTDEDSREVVQGFIHDYNDLTLTLGDSSSSEAG